MSLTLYIDKLNVPRIARNGRIYPLTGGGNTVSSGTEESGMFLKKTGDNATGSYTFDGLTLIIDSIDHVVSIGTTGSTCALNVNSSTGECLRLIYDDSDGQESNYAQIQVGDTGNLFISATGGMTSFTDDNIYTAGGLGIGDDHFADGVVNVGVGFRIGNAATAGAVLRGNGTNFVSSAAAALSKVDDTNVTLTLGGTPGTSLLDAVSLTLGWTGQLAVSRGGTGLSSAIAYSVLCGGTTGTGAFQSVSGLGNSGQVLTSQGAGSLPTWTNIFTAAALSKSDDTNVTITLGGTPNTSLLQAVSLTMGWSGQLSVARGGTGGYSFNPYAVLCGGTTTDGNFQSIASVGSAGQVLKSNGAGNLPSWQNESSGSNWTVSGNNIYRGGYSVGIGINPSGNYALEISPNLTTVLNSDYVSYPQLLVRNGNGTATIGNTYIPAWAMIGAAFVSSKIGDNYSNIGSFHFGEGTNSTGYGAIGGLFGANDTGSGNANGILILGVTSAGGNTYGIKQLGGNINYFAGNTGIGVDPAAFKLDVEGASTDSFKFGATIPIYLINNGANIGFNAYYSSGWKYGKGSSGVHAGAIGFNQSTGELYVASSAAVGNANGAVTMNYRMKIFQNGNVQIVGGNLEVVGNLILNNGDYTVTLATTNISNDYTYELPDGYGNNGQILTTDGAGTLSWTSAGSSMVYPGAGIPISTGSAWGTSITNNSTNWNTAYTHSQNNSQAHSDYLINNGSDTTSGALTATNFILSSDENLKFNIKSYVSQRMGIPYKQFELKTEPGQLRFGVIAQDIMDEYPELVRTDENGILSVAYIDLLIREVAYLNWKIRELEGRMS